MLTLFLYSDSPLPHTRRSLGSTNTGVATRQLAASVSRLMTPFQCDVVLAPGQYSSNVQWLATPLRPASPIARAMAEPNTSDHTHSLASMLSAIGSW